MFNLEYYNHIIHEIKFENYIKSFGYKPIKGSIHDDYIRKWKNLNNGLEQSKVILWKPMREIDIYRYLHILIQYETNNITIKENIKNLKYLENMIDVVYSSEYYKHTMYAVIQTHNQTVGPISYNYRDSKQDLHKILCEEGNNTECSICLETKYNRLSCRECHTITCIKCRKKMKNKCPVCDRS